PGTAASGRAVPELLTWPAFAATRPRETANRTPCPSWRVTSQPRSGGADPPGAARETCQPDGDRAPRTASIAARAAPHGRASAASGTGGGGGGSVPGAGSGGRPQRIAVVAAFVAVASSGASAVRWSPS